MPNSLIRALAASLLLHLAIVALGWWSPLLHDRAPPHTRREFLRASIQPDRAPANSIQGDRVDEKEAPLTEPAASAPIQAGDSNAGPQTVDAKEPGQTRAPRFTRPPSFQAVENYPLPLRFSLRVRLYVSATGLVQRVDVIASTGPVPSDLMDELLSELYNSRLTPAMQDGKPETAALDLTIGAANLDEQGGLATDAGSRPDVSQPGPRAKER